MRWKIKSGVGVGQPNRRDDVKKIQMLLNRSTDEKTPQLLLKEDGFFGPKTKYRIELFQRIQLHMRKFDGIVDPRGPTQRRLRNSRTKTTLHHKRPKASSPHTKFSSTRSKSTILPDDPSMRKLERNAKPDNIKTVWINRALPAAIKLKARLGIPIAVTIAQGALESAYGTKTRGNIYFGIKGKSSQGKSIIITTHETYGNKSTLIQDSFRSYDTLEQSADDYGNFLAGNHRYSAAFNFTDDPEKFVHEVAKAGYATNPDYEKLLISIIRANGLSDYDVPKSK
ncbi:glucosaminidase domain-containing protein [Rahnella woolbedingensis]|uniref:Flagellar biosynthesis protein FlgJ n=1 Tax=Rahnella woolbedingensis TaxID=1510574 RepID=A0A419NDE8_9GAMM|nr:glucosaminidase domain-containing protein [Rahnella woolbedingensis]RJT46506.1 flagellar biosynthesis protein FlgJ [Rahnella woolbedingensis]